MPPAKQGNQDQVDFIALADNDSFNVLSYPARQRLYFAKLHEVRCSPGLFHGSTRHIPGFEHREGWAGCQLLANLASKVKYINRLLVWRVTGFPGDSHPREPYTWSSSVAHQPSSNGNNEAAWLADGGPSANVAKREFR